MHKTALPIAKEAEEKIIEHFLFKPPLRYGDGLFVPAGELPSEGWVRVGSGQGKYPREGEGEEWIFPEPPGLWFLGTLERAGSLAAASTAEAKELQAAGEGHLPPSAGWGPVDQPGNQDPWFRLWVGPGNLTTEELVERWQAQEDVVTEEFIICTYHLHPKAVMAERIFISRRGSNTPYAGHDNCDSGAESVTRDTSGSPGTSSAVRAALIPWTTILIWSTIFAVSHHFSFDINLV